MYQRHGLPRGLVVFVSPPFVRSRQKLVWRSRQPACHPIRCAAKKRVWTSGEARNDVLAYVRDVHWSLGGTKALREPNAPDSWISRGRFKRSRGSSPVSRRPADVSDGSSFPVPVPGIHT